MFCNNHKWKSTFRRGFSGGAVVNNPPANARDAGLIPGSGRSPREGNGNPLQYSCLENPMDGGTRRATVHGVAESGTTERFYFQFRYEQSKC